MSLFKSKNTRLRNITLIISLCLLLPQSGKAQDGTMDSTFNGNGLLVLPGGSQWRANSAQAICQDPISGKLVIADADLVYPTNSDYKPLTTRITTNGHLDSTWGPIGLWGTQYVDNIPYIYPHFNKVFPVGGGRFVAAGQLQNYGVWWMMRYRADGLFDSTFNSSFALDDKGHFMEDGLMLPDSSFVLAGYRQSMFTASDSVFVMVRKYKKNGDLDNAFANNGTMLYFSPGTYLGNMFTARGHGVAAQPDGKLLICGEHSAQGNGAGYLLMRLNANGTLDSSFGTNGVLKQLGFNKLELMQRVAVQADGKVLTAGCITSPADTLPTPVVVRRFKPNGTPDSTFGADGMVSYIGTSAGRFLYLNDMKLLADGKMVLLAVGNATRFYNSGSGLAYDVDSSTPQVFRLKANGERDSTFGTNGVADIYIPVANSQFELTTRLGYSLVIQSDDKIVVGGLAGLSALFVARLNNKIGQPTGILPATAQSGHGVRVFPNPTGKNLSISGATGSTVRVYNNAGQLVRVWNVNLSLQSFDTGELQAGLYFLDVTHLDGTRSVATIVKD